MRREAGYISVNDLFVGIFTSRGFKGATSFVNIYVASNKSAVQIVALFLDLEYHDVVCLIDFGYHLSLPNTQSLATSGRKTNEKLLHFSSWKTYFHALALIV